jgi:hypothetical protein
MVDDRLSSEVLHLTKIINSIGLLFLVVTMLDKRIGFVRVMVFNATFNNMSVISWRSVLLVDETEVSGEYHRPVASHRQTF